MQIQVNTSNNVEGRQALDEAVREKVENELGRFRERITRIEVHLGDENGPRGGDRDQRCTMEARLEGLPPTAVTADAATVEQAVAAAAGKLRRALDTTLGRLADRR